jgi:hypothetical protein
MSVTVDFRYGSHELLLHTKIEALLITMVQLTAPAAHNNCTQSTKRKITIWHCDDLANFTCSSFGLSSIIFPWISRARLSFVGSYLYPGLR